MTARRRLGGRRRVPSQRRHADDGVRRRGLGDGRILGGGASRRPGWCGSVASAHASGVVVGRPPQRMPQRARSELVMETVENQPACARVLRRQLAAGHAGVSGRVPWLEPRAGAATRGPSSASQRRQNAAHPPHHLLDHATKCRAATRGERSRACFEDRSRSRASEHPGARPRGALGSRSAMAGLAAISSPRRAAPPRSGHAQCPSGRLVLWCARSLVLWCERL